MHTVSDEASVLPEPVADSETETFHRFASAATFDRLHGRVFQRNRPGAVIGMGLRYDRISVLPGLSGISNLTLEHALWIGPQQVLKC